MWGIRNWGLLMPSETTGLEYKTPERGKTPTAAKIEALRQVHLKSQSQTSPAGTQN